MYFGFIRLRSLRHSHPKVEYLENLRLRKEEDDDAAEFSEGDTREYGGTHVNDGVVRAANSGAFGGDGKGTCDVRAKLDGNTYGHDQVHLYDVKYTGLMMFLRKVPVNINNNESGM